MRRRITASCCNPTGMRTGIPDLAPVERRADLANVRQPSIGVVGSRS